MRFNAEKISLNGIQVFPSSIYIAGLHEIKSFSKQNTTSDLLGDGEYLGNSKLEPRTFTLNIATKKRYDVINDFRLNQVLSQKNILLAFKLKGYNNVLETYVNTESVAEDNFGQLTVTLKAYDPYLYLQEEKKVSLKTVRYNEDFNFRDGKTFSFAEGFDFKNEIIEGNKSEILLDSFVTCYPTIEINGLCSNFSVTNNTTGETLKINTSIKEDEILEIDCNPLTRSVYLYNNVGKKTNLISVKSGNYLSLINGSNIISATYDGTANVLVKWKERFV